MSIANDWERILAWYSANTPSDTLAMSPGATHGQLASLEALIGTHLPDDFRESYLLYNGTARGWILYHGLLRSLDSIAAEWQQYRTMQEESGYGKGFDWQPAQLESPEIRPYWWGPLRIPITDNGGGDPVTLDLDPWKNRGTRGQIIKVHHEVGPINVLASGFAAWLGKIAEELEAGVHIFCSSNRMVRPVSWGRR